MENVENKKIDYLGNLKILFMTVYENTKIQAILIIILKVIGGLLPAIYIVVFGKFIDTMKSIVEGSKNITEVYKLAPLVIIFGVLKYFLNIYTTYQTGKFSFKYNEKMQLKIKDKISRLKYSNIENSETYKLIERVNRGHSSSFIVGFQTLFGLIQNFLQLFSIAIPIYFVNKRISFLIFLCLIPIIFISIKFGEKSYVNFTEVSEVYRKVENLEELFYKKEFAAERITYGYQEYIKGIWDKLYVDLNKITIKFKKIWIKDINTVSISINLVFILIIYLLFDKTINSEISIGIFSTVIFQLLDVAKVVSVHINANLSNISNAIHFIEDYKQFMNLEEREGDIQDIENKDFSFEKIEFKNVTFTYPGNTKPTLKNLNLQLLGNKSYSIVGKNGAGKTTITKLLLGLFSEYEGEILIDGISIKEIKNVNKLFSCAFQDFSKYEISLLNNIVFGKEADIENIKNVLKVLDLYDENDEESKIRFENGLNTELGYINGEKSNNLSIGQWQKLILVRSIVQNGKYFILDEPTAALDPSAESKVYEDFLKIIDSKSALIITHRLGAAKLSDEIIVINDGSVVEKGTHDELLNKIGLYSSMYEAQKGWYKNE